MNQNVAAKPEVNALVDKLAAEVYDYCCSHRADNKSGKPQEVSRGGFDSLYDNSKEFYRNVARWHLDKFKSSLTVSPHDICYDFYCHECKSVIHPTMSGIMLCDKHKSNEKIPDGTHNIRYLGSDYIQQRGEFNGNKLVKIL